MKERRHELLFEKNCNEKKNLQQMKPPVCFGNGEDATMKSCGFRCIAGAAHTGIDDCVVSFARPNAQLGFASFMFPFIAFLLAIFATWLIAADYIRFVSPNRQYRFLLGDCNSNDIHTTTKSYTGSLESCLARSRLCSFCSLRSALSFLTVWSYSGL